MAPPSQLDYFFFFLNRKPIGLFLHAPKLTQSTCFFHRLMPMTNKLITADPRAPTLMAIGTHLISGHFEEEGKSFCLTKIY